MSTILYRDAAQVVTVGNTPIILPLGKGVGGTTMINSGTCFRTPEPVLEMWGERFGLDELSADELDPYFRRVERELNVVQVPEDRAGRNALVVKRGADALGWSGDFIWRNARGCVGSGVCSFGCPTSAKQHVGLSYVPRAWAAGATTYTECQRASGSTTTGGAHARSSRRRRAAARLHVDSVRTSWSPAARSTRRSSSRASGLGRALGRARPQPRDPPGHGRARALRRGDRHGEWRAAVVLHRRVRGRGDHARGRRRARPTTPRCRSRSRARSTAS